MNKTIASSYKKDIFRIGIPIRKIPKLRLRHQRDRRRGADDIDRRADARKLLGGSFPTENQHLRDTVGRVAQRDAANFRGLVLCCIEAKSCKKICV